LTGTSKRTKADRESKAKVESLLQPKTLKTTREHEQNSDQWPEASDQLVRETVGPVIGSEDAVIYDSNLGGTAINSRPSIGTGVFVAR